MAWVPKYRVYEDDGLTLVYTFDAITGDISPLDPKRFSEAKNIRGQGSIIVPGSDDVWDLPLDFHLSGDEYEDIIAKMHNLKDTIVVQTKYILKIDLTQSTTENYNVMRLLPIQWDKNKRVTFQKGIITFRVNTW